MYCSSIPVENYLGGTFLCRVFETLSPFQMCSSVPTAVSVPGEDLWADGEYFGAPRFPVNACAFEVTVGG